MTLNPIRILRRWLDPYGGFRPDYNADFLRVWNKNVSFLKEERFAEAYTRGMQSGHTMGGKPNQDLHIEWRMHVICWAASHAVHLPGDFVECGVNTGIFSLTIAHYVDFNATGKRLYLFDTFSGIPKEHISERERSLNRPMDKDGYYEECFETAKKNFAPYPRAQLVRGMVPDTLSGVQIDQVCYLSIDMNVVLPEIAAINHFWDKLVPGAPVILDDYGWRGFDAQKEAMDDFAARKNVKILTSPTGQGILIKPPR